MTYRRHALAIASLTFAALLAACSSTPSTLQTATGDTKPAPVTVQVPVQVLDPATVASGCWVQLYTERNFKGDMATLSGPVQLDSADKFTGKQLKKQIDSLVTGPKATLTVYEHSMFKDRSMAFGPNSREAGLLTKLGIGGDIQSLQLNCDS